MSTKQLARIAGVLVAVLVLWGILALTRRPPADRVASLVLPKIDTAAVDTIALTRPHDTVILARGAHGAWNANGHPAAASAVTSLLDALRDTSAWSELVAEHASSHARLGVTADSGRRMRVVSHGRTLLDLVAGNRTSDYSGIYVRPTAREAVYALHGPLADAVTRSDDDWRDKRIAAVAPESVTTIDVTRGARSYALERASGAKGKGSAWHFASGQPADSTAVANLLSQFRELAASGFATPAQADSADFTHSRRRVRLLGKSTTPLVDLVFDSTKSGVWTRADSGGTVFRLDTWTLNQLTPAESTLEVRVKKRGARK